jgi:protein arginine N-methyltransferase 5
MRNIVLEEKADILVSELLGSFADNELSPECLDGVQHLLKSTGISIPSNSKSYIQPIMSKRTYGQVQKRTDEEKNKKREKYSEYTEVNWLIYSTNIFHIDKVQEVFTFVHPNKDDPIDNSRYGKFNFEASIDCVLHGFSGYFSSELYKGIEISIEPTTHTQGEICSY